MLTVALHDLKGVFQPKCSVISAAFPLISAFLF